VILVGQYDSSFVRRVAIALRLYGQAFEHRPWSVFGDAQKVMALNPLGRVPILILDDGEVLTDGAAILDHLDEAAGASALLPRSGSSRRAALRVVTLATGLAERTVSLFYERHLAQEPGPVLMRRLEERLRATLAALEAGRNASHSPWWFGETLSHADIAVACAIRHLSSCMPDQWDEASHPALARHCAKAEALSVFQEMSQPFVGPT
jgi:glutathione S-transferase